MDSRTCCSLAAADTTTCGCFWNCDRDPNCDLTGKTNVPVRRKREFTPDEQKDDGYWLKRSRNNEAARRSRERRRTEERLLEARTGQLIRENQTLKAALSAFHSHGINDAMVKYRVRNLPANSYLGSWAGFPTYESFHVPPAKSFSCAPSSGRDFSPGYKSDTESFSTGSSLYTGPVQDDFQPRHKYVHPLFHPAPIRPITPYKHGPFLPSENLSDQGLYHTNSNATSELRGHPPTAAPQWPCLDTVGFSTSGLEFHKEELLCKGCKRSYIPIHGCTARVASDANHAKEEPPIIEANEMKDKSGTGAECVSALPLLPHKLRHKANKKQYDGLWWPTFLILDIITTLHWDALDYVAL